MYPIDRTGSLPTEAPTVTVFLSGRAADDLNWKITPTEKKIFWQLDLGLEKPDFPFRDELVYRSLQLALETFTQQIWPRFQRQTVGISFYTGVAGDEEFCNYCQMLSAHLPDELPITLLLRGRESGVILARFEHFQVVFEEGEGIVWNEKEIFVVPFQTRIGVCVPEEETDLSHLPFPYRIIPERFLNEKWMELDYLYVFSRFVTPRGRRMLQGFCAAGGIVVTEGELLGLANEIGAEGFEPPAYWSQTSRASQTALCPEEGDTNI